MGEEIVWSDQPDDATGTKPPSANKKYEGGIPAWLVWLIVGSIAVAIICYFIFKSTERDLADPVTIALPFDPKQAVATPREQKLREIEYLAHFAAIDIVSGHRIMLFNIVEDGGEITMRSVLHDDPRCDAQSFIRDSPPPNGITMRCYEDDDRHRRLKWSISRRAR